MWVCIRRSKKTRQNYYDDEVTEWDSEEEMMKYVNRQLQVYKSNTIFTVYYRIHESVQQYQIGFDHVIYNTKASPAPSWVFRVYDKIKHLFLGSISNLENDT